MSEIDELRGRLDRLESLVGTAYNRTGTIRPALESAMLQTDIAQMRQEVQSVVNFLRDNSPNPE